MKSIYIAGPYTSKDGVQGEDRNIHIAAEVAAKYAELGWAVFCPHTMSSYIDREFTHDSVTWEGWLTMDIHWISKCDAIHMLPGWEDSKGASLEHMVATALGLEIHYDIWR